MNMLPRMRDFICRHKIVVFFILFFTYFVFYLGRSNISYVSKVLIDLGRLDVMAWGLLVSVSSITYGISKFISGMLVDMVGVKKILLLGLATVTAMNFLMPIADSSKLIFLVCIINQIAQGTAYAACLKSIVNWWPLSQKTRIFSFWSASHRMGTSVTGFIATLCIARAYWQGAFIVPAIVTAAMFLVILLFYFETPTSTVGNPDDAPATKKPSLSDIYKNVLCNKNVLILCISSMGIYYGYFFILNWSILFLVDKGFSITKSTGVLAFLPLLGCFGGISAGFIIDKLFKSRILPVIAISLTVVVGLLMFMFLKIDVLNTGILIIIMLLLGFFTDIPQIMSTLATTNFVTKQFTGSAAGFAGFCHYVGASLTGVLTASLKMHYGWTYAFWVCCLLIIFSIIGCIVLFKQERLQIESLKITTKKQGIEERKLGENRA